MCLIIHLSSPRVAGTHSMFTFMLLSDLRFRLTCDVSWKMFRCFCKVCLMRDSGNSENRKSEIITYPEVSRHGNIERNSEMNEPEDTL